MKIVKIINSKKECTLCKKWKHVSKFKKNEKVSFKLNSQCIECRFKKGQEYYYNKKNKIKKSKYVKKFIICKKCNIKKRDIEFYKYKKTKFNLVCKKCTILNHKQKSNPIITRIKKIEEKKLVFKHYGSKCECVGIVICQKDYTVYALIKNIVGIQKNIYLANH